VSDAPHPGSLTGGACLDSGIPNIARIYDHLLGGYFL
jgi:hypothetical protein